MNSMLREYSDLKEEVKIERLIQFVEDSILLIKQCLIVQKKYRKEKFKTCKDKKRENNAFIKMCSV